MQHKEEGRRQAQRTQSPVYYRIPIFFYTSKMLDTTPQWELLKNLKRKLLGYMLLTIDFDKGPLMNYKVKIPRASFSELI